MAVMWEYWNTHPVRQIFSKEEKVLSLVLIMLVGLMQAVSLSKAWQGSMLALESWELILIQIKHGWKRGFTLTRYIPARGYRRLRHQASNERQAGEWRCVDR
jgi:hypothetical protein